MDHLYLLKREAKRASSSVHLVHLPNLKFALRQAPRTTESISSAISTSKGRQEMKTKRTPSRSSRRETALFWTTLAEMAHPCRETFCGNSFWCSAFAS